MTTYNGEWFVFKGKSRHCIGQYLTESEADEVISNHIQSGDKETAYKIDTSLSDDELEQVSKRINEQLK